MKIKRVKNYYYLTAHRQFIKYLNVKNVRITFKDREQTGAIFFLNLFLNKKNRIPGDHISKYDILKFLLLNSASLCIL